MNNYDKAVRNLLIKYGVPAGEVDGLISGSTYEVMCDIDPELVAQYDPLYWAHGLYTKYVSGAEGHAVVIG